ncbi:LysR family transcriptional regulator [Paraburkholderia sp. ZP32-5]|uniref:LysR family transcriptional regulator n=1 Tax=Paraburkholderia sp. ZP32-5 TaxID=2883245 RepID=UPI001F43823E|nr:LysR family transcriptional regulator [Paraburkholderia sp. ZP32-5]
MLDLNDFLYFVQVVDTGGISAAATALQRAASTVSYRIQQLECELGLALLARTTRSIVMTQAGEEFYRYATSMLERANEAERVMRSRCKEPAGIVHYAVAPAIAQFAMPGMLLAFLAQYPKIQLVQHVVDSQTDIVARRYDLAIHAHSGPLPDSQLIQRPLAEVPWHLFASADYLRRVGPLKSPDDLDNCETLVMKREDANPAWRMHSERDKTQFAVVRLRPRIYGACTATLKEAAEAGLGIVALPAYICRQEVLCGRLRRVLPDWIALESTVTALMPHRGLTAGARAFIDHIATAFPSAVRFCVSSESETVEARGNLPEELGLTSRSGR